MNENNSSRPARPPVRPGRIVSGLAAAIVALSVILIALVMAPAPRTQADATSEPLGETFTAIGTLAAPSPSVMSTTATMASPAAPSLSAAPVLSPSPAVDPNHIATRVRVPDLRIDLAVVAPPKDLSAYPKCNVAMYLAALHQPGGEGATYLYAHARTGMFLPIFERAIQRLHGGPKSMLGMSVEVFTSDNLRYRYTIEEVRVHQTSLGEAELTKVPELWLQTSEGPKGTRGKTQVRALPVDVTTATQQQAHPTPKPVSCG